MGRGIKFSFATVLFLCGALDSQAEVVYGDDSDYHWVKLYDCEGAESPIAINSASPKKLEELCQGSTKLREEVYYYAESFHRDNGPALVKYDESGNPHEESWYHLGRLHREGGPAERHFSSGSLTRERWYKHGLRTRTDGPAEISYVLGPDAPKELASREIWLKEGLKHRLNGPAETAYALRKNHGESSQLAESSASEQSKDAKAEDAKDPRFKIYDKWYQEGALHREDGPALVRYDLQGAPVEQKKFLKGVEKK